MELALTMVGGKLPVVQGAPGAAEGFAWGCRRSALMIYPPPPPLPMLSGTASPAFAASRDQRLEVAIDMATPDQILELARRVAKKTRTKVPRSQNRQLKKAWLFKPNPTTSDWVKDGVPAYLSLKLAAQRASKQAGSAKKPFGAAKKPTEAEMTTIRASILGANLDMSMRKRSVEADYDKTALHEIDTRLKAAGLDVVGTFYPGKSLDEALLLLLGSGARQGKSLHRDGTAVTPLEKLESNAKNATHFGIGNCVECASLAFVMLMEYAGPGSDAKLPPLTGLLPIVEKAKVSNPGDHHFVLINRNVSIAIGDTAGWIHDPHLVICDPWWFTDDGGDAHFFVNPKARDLRQEILENAEGLAVDLALPLGSGHSTRFSAHHGTVNYYTS
jgi:hypothetical protein